MTTDTDRNSSLEAATIATTKAGGFRTSIVSAGYDLVADEPAELGGSGQGPSPYDLLSAALASCTTMTLQMYAARKKIGLRSASVRVWHSKVHARDCEDCETRDGRIDELRREIVIDGDLTTDERQRLLDIADKCPVHRTLSGEIKVRTTLAD